MVVWYDVLNGIQTYFKSVKYLYNDVNIHINNIYPEYSTFDIKLIDNITKINRNISDCLYLTKDTFNIYYNKDLTNTIIYTLVKKDKITVSINKSKIDYFISDYSGELLEISNINNNTISGDIGLNILLGQNINLDPMSTLQTPAVSFMMQSESGHNLLEQSYVSTKKEIIFNIVLMTREHDSYNNFVEYEFTKKLASEILSLLEDYFKNSYYNDYSQTIANRITEIYFDFEIIDEGERPLILSNLKFQLIYR